MKLKHILGTVTIIAIIGGTIYAIKKHKDLEKTEGEAISLDEARAIVADKGLEEVIEVKKLTENEEPYKSYDTVKVYRYLDELEEDEDEDEYEDIDETTDGPSIDEGGWEVGSKYTNNEEDEELRFEPNSKEAREQYIKMELAEWIPLEDTYETLLRLFDFPFKPKNDGDHILMTQIIDFKVQFFGFESKWAREVSIADIILHYARAAEFNCGESVRYWAEYFLDFNELDYTQPSHEIDDILDSLNSHAYFNEERQTFGLFGLTRESMDQAIKIANRNIDRSVTYEIEFNEFLKSCL